MAYSRNKVLLDPSASTVTGGPYLIADMTQLSLSYVTQTASASNLTVQMSNENGLTAALVETNWSTVTIMPAQGFYGVETGPRWIRVLRASASSATVILQGLVNR